MRKLVTAVFGNVYKAEKTLVGDKTVALIECELWSSVFPPKRGAIKIEIPEKPAEPKVLIDEEWRSLISYVDFSHAALSHYFTALSPGSNIQPTKVTMNVEFA